MSMHFRLMILNGPNLNLLGKRETSWYGCESLDNTMTSLKSQADKLSIQLMHLQTNDEALFIDTIQQAHTAEIEFFIVNAGAWTHTSIAIRDALLAVQIPFIELHVSNIFAREPFRHHSYLSDIAIGQIAGFGTHGYSAALNAAHHYLQQTT